MHTTMRRAAACTALLATGAATFAAPAQAAGHHRTHPSTAATKSTTTTTSTARAHVKTATTAASSGRGGTGKRAARSQNGFSIVGTLRHPVMSMTSPARGKVWLAERTPEGAVVVAEVGGRNWTATTLPIAPGSQGRVKLSGSAANDLWLVADTQLWHFDGRRWGRVSLPAGTVAETVQDVPGPDVYVGLTGDLDSTGIYRLRNGRWNSLGRPASNDEAYGPGWFPRDLAIADGTVFATFEARAHSAHVSQSSFTYEKGTWNRTMETLDFGGGNYTRLGGWLVPDKNHQVVFTSWFMSVSDGALPAGQYCRAWVRGQEDTRCSTRWAVGAAATLRDGRIVVGGDDYQRYDKPVVQGTFGIRTKDGAEKLLAGDPGDRTLGMTVEPGTNTAWAATLRGNEVLLQKWVG